MSFSLAALSVLACDQRRCWWRYDGADADHLYDTCFLRDEQAAYILATGDRVLLDQGCIEVCAIDPDGGVCFSAFGETDTAAVGQTIAPQLVQASCGQE